MSKQLTPLKPLQLDIGCFKAEFKRRAAMTSYQRAMDTAIDKKADAWLSYTPLSKMQLMDDLQPSLVTVRTPINAGNGVKRSTFQGIEFAQATIVWRPTELMATARALGYPVLDEDMLFERFIPERNQRYCFRCKRTKDVSQFAVDLRFPGERAFWCTNCRIDNDKLVWRIAS